MDMTRADMTMAITHILPVLKEASQMNLPVTIDEKNWVVIIGIPKYIPIETKEVK